jgi:hypothetical protein
MGRHIGSDGIEFTGHGVTSAIEALICDLAHGADINRTTTILHGQLENINGHIDSLVTAWSYCKDEIPSEREMVEIDQFIRDTYWEITTSTAPEFIRLRDLHIDGVIDIVDKWTLFANFVEAAREDDEEDIETPDEIDLSSDDDEPEEELQARLDDPLEDPDFIPASDGEEEEIDAEGYTDENSSSDSDG